MARPGELVVTVTRHGDTLHPFIISNTITYPELKKQVEKHVGKHHLRLQYIDENGEEMCLESEDDLLKALRVAYKCEKHVRLVVHDKTRPFLGSRAPVPGGRGHHGHHHYHHHHHPHHHNPPAPPPVGHAGEEARIRAAKKAAQALLLAKPACHQQQQQQQPLTEEPEWFQAALNKKTADVVDGVLKALKSSGIVPPGDEQQEARGPCHDGVICDLCEGPIVGARYKCGYCLDYDLCEKCEKWSEQVHDPSHVFIKLKRPARYAGMSKKGYPKPLIKKRVYNNHRNLQESFVNVFTPRSEPPPAPHQHQDDGEPEREAPEIIEQEVIAVEQQEEVEGTSNRRRTVDGMVVCNREELREQLSAAKQRKKEERKSSEESVATPLTEHKGHGKCLDSKFIVDTSYPDKSTVYYGKQFDKGWVVENTGTKRWKDVTLVHQLGFAPMQPFIEVPELAPGEQTELVVSYPPIIEQDGHIINSSWTLCHKGVAFGCYLWLSVEAQQEPDPVNQLVDTFEQVSYPLASSSAEFAPPPPVDSIPPSLPSLPPPAPAAAEDDEEGFMFVQQPSVLSIASSDSFQHVSDSIHDQEECNVNDQDEDSDDEANETASVVSQKSDDSEFCIVIPECFKLDVPLSGFNPPNHDEEEEQEKEDDRDVTPSPGGYVTPPTEPVQEPVPQVQPEAVSPNTARKQFTPARVTLQRVWIRRSTDPLRYATGLVNTVSDLVSKHVRVAPKDTEDEEQENINEENEESAEPSESPIAAPCDISKLVRRRDISPFLNRKWEGLNKPSTPMDRLISMGFADRALNARLLEKHSNNLTKVLEELLDTDGMGYQQPV